MKKIGLYGGSFDPIHFGHINLGLEMVEKHSLDTLLFCPSNITPRKEPDRAKVQPELRLKMVELAISDIAQFKLLDDEVKRGGVSYTVDTLKSIKSKFEGDQLFLILGIDAVNDFANWKSPDEILSLAQPLIGLRENGQLKKELKYLDIFEKGLTKTRLLDISSTDVRERLRLKKYIRHLVPSKVVDYIYANQLYF